MLSVLDSPINRGEGDSWSQAIGEESKKVPLLWHILTFSTWMAHTAIQDQRAHLPRYHRERSKYFQFFIVHYILVTKTLWGRMNVTYRSARALLPFGFQGIISPDSRQFHSLWYLFIYKIYYLRGAASFSLALWLVLLQILSVWTLYFARNKNPNSSNKGQYQNPE